MKVDLRVIQKPIYVKFDCPHCGEEIEVDYRNFASDLGEVCDWQYSKFNCHKCDKEVEVDNIEWD